MWFSDRKESKNKYPDPVEMFQKDEVEEWNLRLALVVSVLTCQEGHTEAV